jgi:hypothetical protein
VMEALFLPGSIVVILFEALMCCLPKYHSLPRQQLPTQRRILPRTRHRPRIITCLRRRRLGVWRGRLALGRLVPPLLVLLVLNIARVPQRNKQHER